MVLTFKHLPHMIAKFARCLVRARSSARAACFTLALAHLPVHAQGATKAQETSARQHLMQLRDVVNRQQWKQLPTLVAQARDDTLLGSYASYWLLRWRTQDPAQPIPTQELQRFIQTSRNGLLVERLTAEWLLAAVREGDYATALQLGPVAAADAQVQCAWHTARHMGGQPVTQSEALAAFQAGPACWTMLERLLADKVVAWDALRMQLRAILETSQNAHARRMAALLFNPRDMAAYTALMQDPRKWLKGRKAPSGRVQTELVTLALSRLAREKDREAAANLVQTQWANKIPASHLQWVWSQFGLVSALNVEPKAYRWYRKSGTAPLTDYNHAWQVRAELRNPRIEWAWVERAIRRMSPEQQSETAWTYWLGRALAAQGKDGQARQQYAAIRHVFDFYGQLASEELGGIQPLPPRPSPVTKTELAAARAHPGLQRAVALFALGWRTEAVREWNYALRGMNDRDLRAAAELAREQQIFDRVINTSLRTQTEIDFSQRFIAPFKARVSEKAREIDLDPAWVFGLIRQESRFIMNARSSVGASGLMQLMPATAKWVANKIGMENFRPASVTDFETNTVLGTRYLDMVLRDLDGSQVLASAGYNAGPRRSVRWRAVLQAPVEGAIFTETIPFTETRLYVKHVLSNATYYATLFSGEPQSLKARLGVITPSPERAVDLP